MTTRYYSVIFSKISYHDQEVIERYRKSGFQLPNPEQLPYYQVTVLKESPDRKKRYIFSTTGEIALQLKRPDRESWESPFQFNYTDSERSVTVLRIPEDPQSDWGLCYSFNEGGRNPRMSGGWRLSSKDLEARYQMLCNGGGYYEQDIFYHPALVAAT